MARGYGSGRGWSNANTNRKAAVMGNVDGFTGALAALFDPNNQNEFLRQWGSEKDRILEKYYEPTTQNNYGDPVRLRKGISEAEKKEAIGWSNHESHQRRTGSSGGGGGFLSNIFSSFKNIDPVMAATAVLAPMAGAALLGGTAGVAGSGASAASQAAAEAATATTSSAGATTAGTGAASAAAAATSSGAGILGSLSNPLTMAQLGLGLSGLLGASASGGADNAAYQQALDAANANNQALLGQMQSLGQEQNQNNLSFISDLQSQMDKINASFASQIANMQKMHAGELEKVKQSNEETVSKLNSQFERELAARNKREEQNAMKANMALMKEKARSKAGTNATMLTSPLGIDISQLVLGKNSLLGM